MNEKKDNLVWLDLEFSGINFLNNKILEISTVVTDKFLNVIEEGPSYVIQQEESDFVKMDLWCQENFIKTGLWKEALKSRTSVEEAEKKTLEFLQKHIIAGQSPVCGNSICQDRKVLTRCMPKLEDFFSYRSIDVSTLKILASSWTPSLPKYIKDKSHRALDDIYASIEELKYYKKHFLKVDKDMLN